MKKERTRQAATAGVFLRRQADIKLHTPLMSAPRPFMAARTRLRRVATAMLPLPSLVVGGLVFFFFFWCALVMVDAAMVLSPKENT